MDKPQTPSGLNNYELDKKGYIVIEFKRSKPLAKPLVFEDNANEESSHVEEDGNSPWHVRAGVSQDLATKVDARLLNRDDILNSELTELLRGAHYNKYLAAMVKGYLGFRPLPIKTHISKPDGNGGFTKVKCTLFPHQVKVLTWMKEKEMIDSKKVHGLRGGIIKLQMGMGKSLTGIAHSLISPRPSCKEKDGEKGFPTLIVASKTVMLEWKMQGFEKFFGDGVKVLYLHKDYIGKDRFEIMNRKEVVKYDFVVTTYDVCSGICKKNKFFEEALEMGNEHTLMKGKIVSVHTRTRQQSDKPNMVGPSVIYTTPWERVICDESQRFANPDIATYKYMMSIYGRYKWCLTGTPIRNYCTDIWAQLRFCGYTGIERTIEWKRQYAIMMKQHKLTENILSMNYKAAGITLPPKSEVKSVITLKGREKECYDYVIGILRGIRDRLMQNLCDFACVLALFTRLRQCVIAPYLLTAESKREKGTTDEQKKDKEALDMLKNIYKGCLGEWVHDKNGDAGIYSSKMTEIINVLSIIPKNEKVLIFSMFTSVLDLLVDAIRKRLPSFHFVQVDGDTKGNLREDNLREFRTSIKTRGLFMTYKVGAEGLNLIEANHIICIEPWWTSAVEDQAEHRAYRMGQTKEITVHKIYAANSIEDKIISICESKRQMAEDILEGTGKEVKMGSGLNKFTLSEIIGYDDKK